MRIGVCSYWFNRGQAVVSRQLRSALEELGHETFVLARPTRGGNLRPSFVDRTDVWDQPRVTEASSYLIPQDEYLRWAQEYGIEVVFFDQNYQFEEIEALRRSGVRTVGRFVWEHFASEHAGPALAAFDVVYSLTAAERERYAALGLDTPRVRWGCHPELLAVAGEPSAGSSPPTSGSEDTVTFFFPGGFMSKRKPLGATLEAFKRARGDRLRLTIKSQVDRGVKKVRRVARRDKRIEVVSQDLPLAEHLRLFAAADVCLAPSRWEGLGLHLYEATALGLPIITNDNPPMNEVVRHGTNGLLVRGVPAKETPRSGIPAFEPDVEELSAAIEALADPALRSRLAAGASEVRDELRWDRTVSDYADLIATLD